MTRRPTWPAHAALAAMLLPWLATAAASLHALHEHEPHGHLADPMHGHEHGPATPEHEHVLTPAPTPTARLLAAGLDTAAPAAEAGAPPAAWPLSLSSPPPRATVSPPLAPARTPSVLRI